MGGVELACPRCNRPARADAVFCSGCGERLTAAGGDAPRTAATVATLPVPGARRASGATAAAPTRAPSAGSASTPGVLIALPEARDRSRAGAGRALSKSSLVLARQRPRVPEQSATLGISKERPQALLAAARLSSPTDSLLVLLMLDLGLRVSEAVGTRIDDLAEQGRQHVLRIKGKGQTTKATLVPLNKPVAEAIAAATRGRSSGPLLLNERGLSLSRQQAGRRVKRLGEQVGVPELHPHALRHAFVTLALEEGASLRDFQDGA